MRSYRAVLAVGGALAVVVTAAPLASAKTAGDIAYSAGRILVNTSFPHGNVQVHVHRGARRSTTVTAGCEALPAHEKGRWVFRQMDWGYQIDTFLCSGVLVDRDNLSKPYQRTYRRLRVKASSKSCKSIRWNGIKGLPRKYKHLARKIRCSQVRYGDLNSGRGVLHMKRCGRSRSITRIKEVVQTSHPSFIVRFCGGPGFSHRLSRH